MRYAMQENSPTWPTDLLALSVICMMYRQWAYEGILISQWWVWIIISCNISIFWPIKIGSILLFLAWCSAHGAPPCPAVIESGGHVPPVPHGVGASEGEPLNSGPQNSAWRNYKHRSIVRCWYIYRRLFTFCRYTRVLSVRPSVCPSRSGFLSRRIKIRSCGLQCQVGQSF